MAATIASLLPARGKQVLLRGFRTEDAPLVEHWSMPGHRWHELDGPYFKGPTEAQAKSRAQRVRESVAAGDVTARDTRAGIARADDDARLLGWVVRYTLDETGWLAVGIVIFDDTDWGQGFGREALALWIDLLFRADPDLHRLDLRTWSGNRGMMRVAELCGFTLDARFREARVVAGVRYDGLGYGILRREWALRSSEVRTSPS